MNKSQLKLFFSRISKAVLEAGELAKSQQGKVKNIGKVPEKMSGDSEKQLRDRGTKTIIDEQVQEILLQAATEVLDPKTILLDAEEDTSSVKLFKQNDSLGTSLVLDPIDATAEYIDGKDSYSICVGLIEKGQMKIAIVYFPARNNFYFLGPDGKSYLNNKVITAKMNTNNTIYKNNRVPENVIKNLEKKGYAVFDDTYKNIGAADCLIACIKGKALAYISHTRQIRDILLAPILVGAGGYAVDWEGNDLIWPKRGRVSRAVFGVGNPLDIIL